MEEREYEQPIAQDPDSRRAAAFTQWDRATAPKPRWRRRGPVAAAVGAALAVGAAAWLTAGGGHAAPRAAPTASASTLSMQGTLVLSFGSPLYPNASDPEPGRTAGPDVGDPCTALNGYNDINQGSAVTIGDGTGRTLVVTALSAGSVAGDPGTTAQCEFSFSANVPAGRGTYTVTISHRGTQVFT